jgi:two-component system, OmpR family, response regulator
MPKVLVIEDDSDTSEEIKLLLNAQGHSVTLETNGANGLAKALSERFDVIALDRMLPHIGGLDILSRLRESGNTVPVLLISALGLVEDRVQGLKAGGDDYLIKPFAAEELLARVEALIRRQQHNLATHFLQYADLELDLLQRSAKRASKSIELVAKEFRLLEYLVRHSDQVLTKKMILESLWNLNFDPSTNFIEVHIARLRKKIDTNGLSPLIHTVRGAGYMLSKKP